MDKYIGIMNLERTCSLTAALHLLLACQSHNSGCFYVFPSFTFNCMNQSIPNRDYKLPYTYFPAYRIQQYFWLGMYSLNRHCTKLYKIEYTSVFNVIFKAVYLYFHWHGYRRGFRSCWSYELP